MTDTEKRSWSGLRRRVLRLILSCMGLLLMQACTTTSFVLGAVGVATDTSIPWAVTKHLYAKMTEGDPLLCMQLNSVQRALSARCGAFVEGSLRVHDIARSELQECPLTVAAHDPQFWPVLPELIRKGAHTDSCFQSPLRALAEHHACPAFSSASGEVIRAIQWLANNDSRSVSHDVVRMLSCPDAQVAKLDGVIQQWFELGLLQHEQIDFSVLGALHPNHLHSALAHQLEQKGHKAQFAWRNGTHKLPSGFEEALKMGHFKALDWWLDRMPELINRVPAMKGDQLPWVPMARIFSPNFMAERIDRKQVIHYLLARGADPWRSMPFNPSMTVIAYAQSMKSPEVELLIAHGEKQNFPPSVLASTQLPIAP